MTRITIVLADDHAVLRQGIGKLLSVEPDMSVVGEAEDGLSARELVRRHRPVILVLDMIMPKVAGLAVIQQVSQCSPHTRVIAFSMCADDEYAWLAFQNGAAAYVTKNAPADELVKVIRDVAAGRCYPCPPLPALAVAANLPEEHVAPAPVVNTLTQREKDVLGLIAKDQTNAEIALELGICESTVAFHVRNLLIKLDARNRTGAVTKAIQQGWLVA